MKLIGSYDALHSPDLELSHSLGQNQNNYTEMRRFKPEVLGVLSRLRFTLIGSLIDFTAEPAPSLLAEGKMEFTHFTKYLKREIRDYERNHYRQPALLPVLDVMYKPPPFDTEDRYVLYQTKHDDDMKGLVTARFDFIDNKSDIPDYVLKAFNL